MAYKLWVGGYTENPSEGIARFSLDDDGALSLLDVCPESSPSYLALNNGCVFTARENGSGVGAFEIIGDELSFTCAGDFSAAPCHVFAHKDHVYAACYGAGVLASLRFAGGKLTVDGRIEYKEVSFAAGRTPRTHQVQVSPDGKYLCVVDLGLDSIIFHALKEDGSFELEPSFVEALPEHFGPRHLSFAPSGHYAYLCGEYSNKVVAYAYADGTLKALQTRSTLPDGFEGKSFCAGVRHSADGKLLLVSNRGHNTMAVFPVCADGTLGALSLYPCGGDFPREFALSPDEKFLVCANQKSSTLDVHTFNNKTGELRAVSSFSYNAPTAIVFDK